VYNKSTIINMYYSFIRISYSYLCLIHIDLVWWYFILTVYFIFNSNSNRRTVIRTSVALVYFVHGLLECTYSYTAILAERVGLPDEVHFSVWGLNPWQFGYISVHKIKVPWMNLFAASCGVWVGNVISI